MARRRRSRYDAGLEEGVYLVCFAVAMWITGKTGNLVVGMFTLFGLAFIILFVGWRRHQANTARLVASGINDVEKMTGKEFEIFLLGRFRLQGYKSRLTAEVGDYGTDLILEKDGRRIAAQVKRWKRTVGVEAVQQIAAGMKHYNADEGMVITNSHFTANARTLAKSNGVELWDKERLIEFLLVE